MFRLTIGAFAKAEDISVEQQILRMIYASMKHAWAVFILNNRSRAFKDIDSPERNHDNKYDLVVGPVANDDLALLFRQFESGLISVETLVEGMKYKKLTNQYSFHSERAIEYLKKEGVINV